MCFIYALCDRETENALRRSNLVVGAIVPMKLPSPAVSDRLVAAITASALVAFAPLPHTFEANAYSVLRPYETARPYEDRLLPASEVPDDESPLVQELLKRSKANKEKNAAVVKAITESNAFTAIEGYEQPDKAPQFPVESLPEVPNPFAGLPQPPPLIPLNCDPSGRNCKFDKNVEAKPAAASFKFSDLGGSAPKPAPAPTPPVEVPKPTPAPPPSAAPASPPSFELPKAPKFGDLVGAVRGGDAPAPANKGGGGGFPSLALPKAPSFDLPFGGGSDSKDAVAPAVPAPPPPPPVVVEPPPPPPPPPPVVAPPPPAPMPAARVKDDAPSASELKAAAKAALSDANKDAKALVKEANAEASALESAAKDLSQKMISNAAKKAGALKTDASSKLKEEKADLASATSEARRVVDELSRVDKELAKATKELDGVFFLDFGKKGELEDVIKSLKADGKTAERSLERLTKAVEQGERGVADAEAALEKANAQASRLESEAAGDAEDIVKKATAKAEKLRQQAEGRAAREMKQGEREAAGFEKKAMAAEEDGVAAFHLW